ncbi:MAG TPA: hypothetical protein VGS10_15810 [Terracidiphilus sp.]|nr:hypothetical protein [Terracidiphilus sp.]
MSRVPRDVLDLPLEQRALLALKEAVRKAIAERRRLGLPVYVWSGGRVVDISSGRKRNSRPVSKSKRIRSKSK